MAFLYTWGSLAALFFNRPCRHWKEDMFSTFLVGGGASEGTSVVGWVHMFWPFPMVGPICRESMEVHDFIPDLPVSYLLGTKLPVANVWRNDRPLVPNTKGTGRWGSWYACGKICLFTEVLLETFPEQGSYLWVGAAIEPLKVHHICCLVSTYQEMRRRNVLQLMIFMSAFFNWYLHPEEANWKVPCVLLVCLQHWGSESLKV